jgi:hypothetical protein
MRDFYGGALRGGHQCPRRLLGCGRSGKRYGACVCTGYACLYIVCRDLRVRRNVAAACACLGQGQEWDEHIRSLIPVLQGARNTLVCGSTVNVVLAESIVTSYLTLMSKSFSRLSLTRAASDLGCTEDVARQCTVYTGLYPGACADETRLQSWLIEGGRLMEMALLIRSGKWTRGKLLGTVSRPISADYGRWLRT